MTGLVLKLGPHERIMINGVVMENGDRRARLNVLTPDANVLRLRDAIHPDEVNTPGPAGLLRRPAGARRRGRSRGGARASSRAASSSSAQVFQDPESRGHLDAAAAAVGERRFYQTMRALRALLPREARLLGYREAS